MDLFDIFEKHVGTGCILLYGETADSIISRDLCIREFRIALSDVLHEAGYDNVVLFDSPNTSGKCIFKAASAVCTGVPSEKTDHGNAGNTSDICPSGTDDAANSSVQNQQRNLGEEGFHAEIDAYMKNDTCRSAVILTDLNKFLRNPAVRDRFSEDIRHNWNKKNLLIFIHPDINTPYSRELYRMLSEAGLLSEFYNKVQGEENYVPKADRVFKIYGFLEDEVRYLLTLAGIRYGFSYPNGIEKTSEKITYILKSSEVYENIKLSAFFEMIQKYADDHADLVFDDAALAKLFDCDIKTI